MKLHKIMGVLLFIMLFAFLFPTTMEAKTYKLPETDATVEMDDSEWYVFTRGNIKDNKELEELEITYDYINTLMQNNYIYMDAILYFEDSDDYIELFVRKKQMNELNQLTNFSDADVLDLAKELAKNQGATNYKVYKSDYKYAKLEYQSQGFYLHEYYTIVNGYGYTITAQKPEKFSSEDAARIEKIVKEIKFDVNNNLKDNTLKKDEKNQNLTWIPWVSATVGAVIASYIVQSNITFSL